MFTGKHQSKIYPKWKECVFIDNAKPLKGIKLWEIVSKSMVIEIDGALDENFSLYTSGALDVSILESKTSHN